VRPAETSTPPQPRSRPRYALWLLALGLLLYLPDLGRPVVRRQQELRVVMTARDMVQTGRWLEPHFLNEPRLRKPPLMYWLVGAVYRAGAPVNSAAWSRLPSALAGITFLGLLYGLGGPLLGRRRAFVAALVAGASLITLRQARLAETDMTLALLTAASALAGFRALRGGASAWWLAAWIAAGLGFLIKGPAAITLPPLAWLAFALTQRRQVRAPWSVPTFWIGLAICSALIAPWYVWIHLRQNAATDRQLEAEVNALLVESHHQGPVVYYVYTLLQAMLPWGVLLPVLLVPAWRMAARRPGVAFAIAWLATSFLVLSVISSKQIHYALLLVAPTSLVVGAGLHTHRRWASRLIRYMTRGFPVLLAVAAVALAGYLIIRVAPLPILPVAGTMLGLGPRRRGAAQSAPAGMAHGDGHRCAGAAAARRHPRAGSQRVRRDRDARRRTGRDEPGARRDRGALRGVHARRGGVLLRASPARFPATLTEAWHTATPGTLVLATWKDDARPAAAALPVFAAGRRAWIVPATRRRC
jgi:4-amino-4-deoxy-L-arabinose transferase-like glycosyltransferase